MHKKSSVPLAPWPRHHYLSNPGGGGGGLRGVAYKDWARPPPPPPWFADYFALLPLQRKPDQCRMLP